jgi:3-methylcrotonyl-CoA carboxylase alpha subunit
LETRDSRSPWRRHDGWRLVGTAEHALDWSDAGLERHIEIVFQRSGLTVTMDEVAAQVRYIARHGSELELEFDSVPMRASVRRQGADLEVTLKGRSWRLRHLETLTRRAAAITGPVRLVAPVRGRVLDVLVTAGAKVKRGQVLMLLESMKLEYRVTAPADGTIEALNFAAGDVVDDGLQLLDFTPAAE